MMTLFFCSSSGSFRYSISSASKWCHASKLELLWASVENCLLGLPFYLTTHWCQIKNYYKKLRKNILVNFQFFASKLKCWFSDLKKKNSSFKDLHQCVFSSLHTSMNISAKHKWHLLQIRYLKGRPQKRVESFKNGHKFNDNCKQRFQNRKK